MKVRRLRRLLLVMDGDEPTGEQNHVILWLTVLSTLGNEKE